MVLSMKEAYETLNLHLGADKEDVIRSFKKLAIEWHPEKNSHSEKAGQKFQQICNAFQKITLSNEQEVCKSLTKDEMFSLFQHVFLNQSVSTNGYHSDSGASDDDDYMYYERDSSNYKYLKENDLPGLLKRASLSAEQADENAEALVAEEEKERSKSEKRRAKKKRRKEKKKGQQSSAASEDTSSTQSKSQDDKNETKIESGSEEELDPNSAFVAKALNKYKNPIAPQSKNINVVKVAASESTLQSADKSKKNHHEENQPHIILSEKLALQGNENASMDRFEEAIKLFTEAIELNPKDYRFYGNRSYCYEKLGFLQPALLDADTAIKLNADWPKNYYRKGRALSGLHRVEEAEVAFEQVLKLDPSSSDASVELFKLRVTKIAEMGFSLTQAECALKCHNTVDAAVEALLSSGARGSPSVSFTSSLPAFPSLSHPLPITDDVYISDEESGAPAVKAPLRRIVTSSASDPESIKLDPKNVHQFTSIWVGNIKKDITETELRVPFSKFGTIVSMKILPEKFCAFINYKNGDSAGKAMAGLQGKILSGMKLLIRYPDKPVNGLLPGILPTPALKPKAPTTQVKQLGPVNGDECYFFRTTGCSFGNSCRYKHVRGHQGIDKRSWQT